LTFPRPVSSLFVSFSFCTLFALKEAERRSEVSRAALAEEVAALQAAEDDSES